MGVKRDSTDKAFSDAIRESYDYTCCDCARNYRAEPILMHSAHIHTRSHLSTRWNSDYGAIALCATCHRRYTDFPIEWGAFLCRFMGESNYEEAKRLAWTVRRYTKAEKAEIRKHYQSELKRIQQLRAEGERGHIPLVSYD